MAYLFLAAHLLGLVASYHALMSTRTPQGTIAWIVSLNTMPLLALPAYLVLGRNRFRGYVVARRRLALSGNPLIQEAASKLAQHRGERVGVGEALAQFPALQGNSAELLVDGDTTFDSIIGGIARAKKSVLVQFYIVRDDGLGRRLQDALLERVRAGVRVYFLYDEIGSAGLPESYIEALREGGVAVTSFHSTRGSGNRFQLNFRNHRKIVVVDSQEAWVGGHNVGDEYLGKSPLFGHWRDTHMRFSGPAVIGLVISFSEDWKWAMDESLPPDLWCEPPTTQGKATILVLPSGPADRLETASLMYQEAIQSAKKRVWIASPYFVPDEATMAALHLAAMRGVDVRIVIPHVPDQKLVYYSAFYFAETLIESGVKFFRYTDGFLHEKVFLVDDDFAGVGTANFDSRSFRLNFEITAIVFDEAFAADVAKMLESDIASSLPMGAMSSSKQSLWFRTAVRASSLLAPIQ